MAQTVRSLVILGGLAVGLFVIADGQRQRPPPTPSAAVAVPAPPPPTVRSEPETLKPSAPTVRDRVTAPPVREAPPPATAVAPLSRQKHGPAARPRERVVPPAPKTKAKPQPQPQRKAATAAPEKKQRTAVVSKHKARVVGLPSCATIKREYDRMTGAQRWAAYMAATSEQVAHGRRCLGM